ncbi:MAG: hypothetical protein ACLP50_26860 [Solirubrobacteraceae bacterium]
MIFVPDLISAIEEYLAAYNHDAKPFVWTAEVNKDDVSKPRRGFPDSSKPRHKSSRRSFPCSRPGARAPG